MGSWRLSVLLRLTPPAAYSDAVDAAGSAGSVAISLTCFGSRQRSASRRGDLQGAQAGSMIPGVTGEHQLINASGFDKLLYALTYLLSLAHSGTSQGMVH